MERLLDISNVSIEEFDEMLWTVEKVKEHPEQYSSALSGLKLLHLFGQPSTRTRVASAVATRELGGEYVEIETRNSQISRGETIKDTGAVVSRYVDGILARMASHETLVELEESSEVPVINALTDRFHPLQAVSDMYTLKEKGHDLQNTKIAYVGDGNNVSHSLIQAAAKTGLSLVLACPEEYGPDPEIVERGREEGEKTGDSIRVVRDPEKAVADSDAVYTDTWVSMGDEEDTGKKKELESYRVDEELVSSADNPEVMHPLPAHRGEEITWDVLDSDNSIIYDQAENRLYTHKAVLLHLFNAV